jgi:hypothetical protein
MRCLALLPMMASCSLLFAGPEAKDPDASTAPDATFGDLPTDASVQTDAGVVDAAAPVACPLAPNSTFCSTSGPCLYEPCCTYTTSFEEAQSCDSFCASLSLSLNCYGANEPSDRDACAPAAASSCASAATRAVCICQGMP